MQFRDWDEIPEFMKNEEVKRYYEILNKKRFCLKAKRFFDIIMSFFLLIMLSPLFFIVSLWIKLDSRGPVYYKQERITQYGRKFFIFKFRTMVTGADKIGSLVTIQHDPRVTNAGKIIRRYRIDEIPQLLNIISGDMSFVGTRPEVQKYVDEYTDEMKATLLLPAGVTSRASIEYKDESRFLEEVEDIDEMYINKILPEKMKLNLETLGTYSIFGELKLLIKTMWAVFS